MMTARVLLAFALAAALSLPVCADEFARDIVKALGEASGQSPAVVAGARVKSAPAVKAASRKKALRKKSAVKASMEKGFLSEAQEREVLALVDSVCADTWCEGDYNFRFTSFRCGQDSCALEFTLLEWGEKSPLSGPGYTAEYAGLAGEGRCVLTGLTKAEQVVESSAYGRSLAGTFYDTLNDCISGVETKVAALPR